MRTRTKERGMWDGLAAYDAPYDAAQMWKEQTREEW